MEITNQDTINAKIEELKTIRKILKEFGRDTKHITKEINKLRGNNGK